MVDLENKDIAGEDGLARLRAAAMLWLDLRRRLLCVA
jgi:hypothetical protein